jgi:hypothetical protein
MSTATVETHAASLPTGDLWVWDFWLDGICAGGQWTVGFSAETYVDAVKDAAELLDEDPDIELVRVSAVCWPSTQVVLVATVTR